MAHGHTACRLQYLPLPLRIVCDITASHQTGEWTTDIHSPLHQPVAVTIGRARCKKASEPEATSHRCQCCPCLGCSACRLALFGFPLTQLFSDVHTSNPSHPIAKVLQMEHLLSKPQYFEGHASNVLLTPREAVSEIWPHYSIQLGQVSENVLTDIDTRAECRNGTKSGFLSRRKTHERSSTSVCRTKI
jgi:hypothetical protein